MRLKKEGKKRRIRRKRYEKGMGQGREKRHVEPRSWEKGWRGSRWSRGTQVGRERGRKESR